MTPDFDKIIADLQAPQVWSLIGDLQIDLVVALKFSQAKISAAFAMIERIDELRPGIQSGQLIPGLVSRCEAARDDYIAIDVVEIPKPIAKPADPVVEKPKRRKSTKEGLPA